MAIDNIIHEILAKRDPVQVLFVALCGWADTGKTTLAKNIRDRLEQLNIPADCISTDSFMLDRSERNARGISGYNRAALNAERLMNCVSDLKAKKQVDYFPYDNLLGRNSAQHRAIKSCQVIVIEGIHAFDRCIRPAIGLFLYIDGDRDVLENLRFNANIRKRGFTEKEARSRIDHEMSEYNAFVLPNKIHAHMNIRVDDEHNYWIA